MEALAHGGATPLEVLQAATIDGATIIGHADDVGSIVPGKFADLVILTADPLADIRNTMAIAAVIKNGRSYDPLSLASDWPEPRTPPARWFDEILNHTPGLSGAN
ncbi:amidohydrolase family protein [Sphingomonas psychrotolerans]